MSHYNLSVDIFRDHLALLDNYSSSLLLKLHETNSSYTSKLLLEQYLESQQDSHSNIEDITSYLEVIDDCSSLKYAFVKLYNQLEVTRSKKPVHKTKSGGKTYSKKHSPSILTVNVGDATTDKTVKPLNVHNFDSYLGLFENGSVSARINSLLSTIIKSNNKLPLSSIYEAKLITKFEDLIISYLVFVNFQVIINELLNSNFEIINSLNYYQDLQNDNFYYKKFYHFVKIFPGITADFLYNVVGEFKSLVVPDETSGSYFSKENFERFRNLVLGRIGRNLNTFRKLPYNVLMNELSNIDKSSSSMYAKSNHDFDISLNSKSLTRSIYTRKAASLILAPLNFISSLIRYYLNKVSGWIQYPKLVVDGYFATKVSQLSELKSQNIVKLGALVTELPKFDIEDGYVDFHEKNANSSFDVLRKIDAEDAKTNNFFRQFNFDSVLKLQYILTQSELDNLSLVKTDDLLKLLNDDNNSSSVVDISSTLSSNVSNSSNNTAIVTALKSTQYEFVPKYQSALFGSVSQLSRPSSITNNWPVLLIALLYGPQSIRLAYESRYKIIAWLNENLVGTLYKFYQNWIYKPILSIIKTIRHDDNSQISIAGKKSLKSDIDSLERMVIEYLAKKTGGDPSTTLPIDVIRLNIREGDLTPFMKDYEHQLSSPIKNLVVGDLLQSLLIQIQKTKVDGDLVISGIDKLLKSQELVFEFIAILPTGLILIWLLKNGRQVARKGWRSIFSINTNKYKLFSKQNLNQIERLLILSSQDTKDHQNDVPQYIDYYNVGEILIETLLLERNLRKVLPNSRLAELKVDIGDLKNEKLLNEYKIKIIEKIWRNYGNYLN